jgi:hypothetical protein
MNTSLAKQASMRACVNRILARLEIPYSSVCITL